jgi:hypothetical protein
MQNHNHNPYLVSVPCSLHAFLREFGFIDATTQDIVAQIGNDDLGSLLHVNIESLNLTIFQKRVLLRAKTALEQEVAAGKRGWGRGESLERG